MAGLSGFYSLEMEPPNSWPHGSCPKQQSFPFRSRSGPGDLTETEFPALCGRAKALRGLPAVYRRPRLALTSSPSWLPVRGGSRRGPRGWTCDHRLPFNWVPRTGKGENG